MWEPRRLTTLWAFTACYRDSFTFFFYIMIMTFIIRIGDSSWGLIMVWSVFLLLVRCFDPCSGLYVFLISILKTFRLRGRCFILTLPHFLCVVASLNYALHFVMETNVWKILMVRRAEHELCISDHRCLHVQSNLFLLWISGNMKEFLLSWAQELAVAPKRVRGLMSRTNDVIFWATTLGITLS
jgi:hypothetical protein